MDNEIENKWKTHIGNKIESTFETYLIRKSDHLLYCY